MKDTKVINTIKLATVRYMDTYKEVKKRGALIKETVFKCLDY